MSARKKIAFIQVMPESLYAHRLFEGIFAQCHKYNYDVAVFSSMLPVCSLHRGYLDGELNIYELINFDEFDGVIVDAISITEDQTTFVKNMLLEKLQRDCKKPVVSLYLPFGDYYVEHSNDSEMIKCITEHVIVHHGCKNIYFLSGMKDYPVSLEREEPFKRTLAEHNIPFDDSRIFYGDFWYTGGAKLGERIASGEIPMPEAVVCASDHMAIGLVKALVRNGIRVPQDVIVTGFDATQEAALSETSVTSCESNAQKTAANAVDTLVSIIEPDRELIPYVTDVKKAIHEGMSCGCQPDFLHSTRKFKESFYFKNIDYSDEVALHDINIGQLIEGYLAERQAEASSPEECLSAIHLDTYYLRPYKNFYMCLREDWLDIPDKAEKGYPKRMKLAVQASDVGAVGFCDEEHSRVFDTRLMLPRLSEEREEPSVFYFAPLHFKEKTYGYVVLECDLLQKKKLNVVHRNWIRYINNSLEMISTRYRLTVASVRDEMTGAYNRRGMNEKLDTMLKNTEPEDILYVYVIDMDGLKGINDTYGHNDGDFGIMAVCNAAQSITDADSICVRAGGDEFYVIGIGRNGNACDRTADFNKALKMINDNSKKPYQISASIGYCSAPMSEAPDIDKLISEADISMYISKAAKKKRHVGLK